MTITVNNRELDLKTVLSIIKNSNKLEAIKYVRAQVQVGLKESKNIVDNLDVNPNFYQGETEIIIKHPLLDLNNKTQHAKKGSHIIKENNSSNKQAIIIALIIIVCLVSLVLYYFRG